MGGNLLWLTYPVASANVLTTELNSLADGSVTALSAEKDNSSLQHLFADFQLDLASLTISSTAAFASIYIVPTVDGTNYPDWASGAIPTYAAAYFRGTIPIKNVSAATARANFEEVRIPPGKFKVAIRNGVGASFAASSNTLAMRSYSGSYT